MSRAQFFQVLRYGWAGYPGMFLMRDGSCLCLRCARENALRIGRESFGRHSAYLEKGWQVEAEGPHWEGPPINCDECQEMIESAYGDPDAEESEAS